MPEFALSSSLYGKEKLGAKFFREAAENGLNAVEAEYAYEASKRGVSIALETDTHPGINRMLPELISEADPESCGICFDTGHAQIESDAVQTVQWIGSRAICTHLHENDGKKDQHLPPFKGIIAWEKFLRGLTGRDTEGLIPLNAAESWLTLLKRGGGLRRC